MITWLRKHHISIMLGIALLDSIATQFYLPLFFTGFRVSLSVIILPILLYYNPKVNPIIQSLFIMTIGLFMRSVFGFAKYGDFVQAFTIEYPTFIFDLSYGVIYYMFYTRKANKDLSKWFGVIVLNDFCSNVLELGLRTGAMTSGLLLDIPILLVIASIRGILAFTFVMVINYYNSLLKKNEHDERYKNLLLLSSNLSSETYMMKSNMRHIETVMNEAYSLYEKTSHMESKIAEMALNIAKEVHEIKKNYIQVIEGLDTITGDTKEVEVMRMKDLFSILEHHGKLTAAQYENIALSIRCRSDFYVRYHYFLMTVLRNLMNNAMEAVADESIGTIEIEERLDYRTCVIIVKDNGKGIKAKHIDYIFEPGFSTKFNAITGDISRGVGLTLVKELVEDKFKGTIDVKSSEGKGTEFIVRIPLDEIEVKAYEILYS